ncbi:MAG: response regulator [Dongiaceae bacterium]
MTIQRNPDTTGPATAHLPRLLIVDSDRASRALVLDVADSCGFEARATMEPAQFQSIYREFAPDIVMLDLAMWEIGGVELLRILADEIAGNRQIGLQDTGPRILFFGTSDQRLLELAFDLGRAFGLTIAGVVTKPIHIADLQVRLRGLLR